MWEGKEIININAEEIINILDLLEAIHNRAAERSAPGSEARAEHKRLAEAYHRAVWALKFDRETRRIK